MLAATRAFTVAAIGTALSLAGSVVMAAAPAQVVTASSSFGALAAPYTNGFGQPASCPCHGGKPPTGGG